MDKNKPLPKVDTERKKEGKSGLEIKPLGAPKEGVVFTITIVLTPCA